MSFTYQYPRPSLTVDCVVFGISPQREDRVAYDLQVMLVQRKDDPFKGRWAIPGGFVEVSDTDGQGEDLETAARRELKEETDVDVGYLEQLYTFGDPGRDPRGRVIAVAYYALVRSKDHVIRSGSDAKDARWFSVLSPDGKRGRNAYEVLPAQNLVGDATGAWGDLAFDHGKILQAALTRLQTKVRWTPIGFNLLPSKFTLGRLQALYEAILQRPVEKRNFRKRILSMGILAEVGVEEGTGRPGPSATLYQFDKKAYNRAVREGFNFEI